MLILKKLERTISIEVDQPIPLPYHMFPWCTWLDGMSTPISSLVGFHIPTHPTFFLLSKNLIEDCSWQWIHSSRVVPWWIDATQRALRRYRPLASFIFRNAPKLCVVFCHMDLCIFLGSSCEFWCFKGIIRRSPSNHHKFEVPFQYSILKIWHFDNSFSRFNHG